MPLPMADNAWYVPHEHSLVIPWSFPEILITVPVGILKICQYCGLQARTLHFQWFSHVSGRLREDAFRKGLLKPPPSRLQPACGMAKNIRWPVVSASVEKRHFCHVSRRGHWQSIPSSDEKLSFKTHTQLHWFYWLHMDKREATVEHRWNMGRQIVRRQTGLYGKCILPIRTHRLRQYRI